MKKHTKLAFATLYAATRYLVIKANTKRLEESEAYKSSGKVGKAFLVAGACVHDHNMYHKSDMRMAEMLFEEEK